MAIALPQEATAAARGTRIEWRPLVRPGFVLALTLFAYRTSLSSLFDLMRLDTPVAHLALVPFIAGGIAFASRRNDAGPPIHDRQLDWIVGLVLCVAALAANVVLPVRLSTEFWEYRVDLLTMPFFVAGAVALVFGVRSLWKYRLAVLFLFLAWPYPYVQVLNRYLGDFTNVTISVLNSVLRHITLATRVTPDSSVFEVIHHGAPIQMSVASACSGANGLVGFLLVAGAFVLVVDGNRWRKLAWLLTGAALVWALNIVRILVIFWAARRWGEGVAIDGFHPYTGLVVFNVGVLLMVVAMRLFGLKFRSPVRRKAADPAGLPSRPAPNRGGAGSGPKALTALAITGMMAVGVGAFNGDLSKYDRIADSLGSPRLTSFAESRETPPGWLLNDTAQYDWSRRYFGSDSVWKRYTYSYSAPADGESALQANVGITADVIETSDRAALNAYGVESCYTFHGYEVHGRQSVDLGSGIVGGLLTWTSDDTNLTWTTLYWHWPIKTATGTRYERVTLVLNDQTTNKFTSPPITTDAARQLQLDINDVLRGVGSAEDRERLVETRQFMIGFARQLITMRAPAPTG